MADIKQTVKDLLAKADVQIGGTRAWDITVHNDRFYNRIIQDGTVGIGESYMDGDWDCDQIDVMMYKLLNARLDLHLKKDIKTLAYIAAAKLTNFGRKSNSVEIADRHYNIGNDLFEAMLGPTMVYTCAYWKNAKNLDEAQEAKLDLICKKLQLKKGMKVLDIGGGWGSFAKFAAEKYGVSVVNISVSKEQLAYADKRTKGLDVENRFQDYRDVNEKFDRIVSICMIEHVGYKNLRTYFEIAHKNLNEGGMFVLQNIGNNRSLKSGDRWMNKYIFPNSMLPSIKQLAEATEGLFVMEDWHTFGAYYDPTLLAWNENFEKAWPTLKKNYPERFRRMWRLYLLSCAASFRNRNIQVWQVVFSKGGVEGGYTTVR